MHLVIVTGLSGSGKSISLNILEDSGYYCVDNLPAQLLADTVEFLKTENYQKVAVSIDIRSGAKLPIALDFLKKLAKENIRHHTIFLDAETETLIQRFSETRRKHPLSNARRDLSECIDLERRMVKDISSRSHRVDTTNLSPNQLKLYLRQFLTEGDFKTMLLIKSFGFKYGLPPEADFVFDVRCLQNPHYEKNLRALTGKDLPVINFLDNNSNVQKMANDIKNFLKVWIPHFTKDSRNYLTIAIGCTGGKHRSVYIAQNISGYFGKNMSVSVKHREID